MPPSFPFGGMENPCITFVTPCLLAGDRSLADVIIHEISHSWFGNLVTNAHWGEFWLNEGFTMYAQRRITTEIYGEFHVKMMIILWFASMGAVGKSLTVQANILAVNSGHVCQVPSSDAACRKQIGANGVECIFCGYHSFLEIFLDLLFVF